MRELIFIGDSRESLSGFPDEVKREMGYALRFAQSGLTHDSAKPFDARYKAAKRMEEDNV